MLNEIREIKTDTIHSTVFPHKGTDWGKEAKVETECIIENMQFTDRQLSEKNIAIAVGYDKQKKVNKGIKE